MAYISEPLRSLARTSILVGLLNCAIGLLYAAHPYFTTSLPETWVPRSGAYTDQRALIAFRVLPLVVLPGLVITLLAWQLQKGRFWAALALVALTPIEIFRLVLNAFLFDCFGLGVLSIPPLIFAARAAIAFPEIRFHLRSRRRQYTVPSTATARSPLPASAPHAPAQSRPTSHSYVSDPLRGLAKIAITIGLLTTGASLAIIIVALDTYSNYKDAAQLRTAMWMGGIFLFPALAMIALGWLLIKGHFWAASALIVLGSIEGLKLSLLLGPAIRSYWLWPILLLPATLVVRLMIALPEIRFQLRARRRARQLLATTSTATQTAAKPPPRPVRARPILSEPLHNLAGATMGFGGALVGIGILFIFCVMAVAADDNVPMPIPALVFTFTLFCVPGLALIFFALALRRGHIWAAIALVTIAALEVAKMTFIMILFNATPGLPFRIAIRINVVYTLVTAALIVRCLIAIPEIRFQLRSRRHTYGRSGFEPLLHPPKPNPTATPSPLGPPPPALKR